MFENYSVLLTVRDGYANKYGVEGGSRQFGYVPDPDQGRHYRVGGLLEVLDSSLREIGVTLDALPPEAQARLEEARGFTLVTGVGPKGYQSRIPYQQLLRDLVDHPQMIHTIRSCKVFVLINGEPWDNGRPLALTTIEPMEGHEAARAIPVPAVLQDPVSLERVSTTQNGSLPAGELIMRTSNVNMRRSKRYRHVLVYRTQSGYIGYMPVSDLDIQSPYRNRIYGEIQLDALEPFKQNDRVRLADSPLTRAVNRFIAQHIEVYAREFEAQDRRQYEEEERGAISEMNEALDRWKNRFLNEMMQGLWGGDGDGPEPPNPPLPRGVPARLELSLTHNRAGIGVAIRASLRFFDRDGRRIRAVPCRWETDDANVAWVEGELGVINTFAPGNVRLSAESIATGVLSNPVQLEVVEIRGIRIEPPRLTLAAGSRDRLRAVCRLENGFETDAIYLVWTESNSHIARVSASGLVFGFLQGETEVTAGDDRRMADEPSRIIVTSGEGTGRGNQRGRGFPLVLVSGEIDRDPETGEVVEFSSDDPPVGQRPQDVDRNIWWINSAAPLGKLYLDDASGYGYESREWRIYHLERFIDIVVQIALTHGPRQESLTADEWILQWGNHSADIQAAALTDLRHFIDTGALPT
ncbi:MAG: Ig-like domain-containing protein [Gammaproteobacteria bacterium]